MRVIHIDPDKRLIEERDVKASLDIFMGLVGGWIEGHWIVPHFLPGHDAWVDEEGIQNKRTIWLFGHVHIWGPMVIFGASKDGYEQPATASLERVRDLVSFDKPRYLSTGAKTPPL